MSAHRSVHATSHVTLAPISLARALPFFAAGLGYVLAKRKTRVNLASRGLRDLDDRPQGLRDDSEKAALRVQARKVYLEWAAMLALVTLAWPRLG